MRQQLDEPREVRKEAAVIAMVVCCGVPGLFCALIFAGHKKRYPKNRVCLRALH
jgi:hypothetical protein